MSVQKITPKEIDKLPSIGGEPDIAQYMQVLPGVVFTGDQGGQLYIRGGSPVQNKVMMDGMIVYNPFHSIGLFSVFDTDIIRNADIYTGGFGAQYGGRISSIMDVTTIDGNQNEFEGNASIAHLEPNSMQKFRL
jgi:outer membrane receptor protein involved in Fe transport